MHRKKRNLMVVGGHADNAVDLCGEDNVDGKRQCLGKGQTMLTNPPSQYGETRYDSRVTIRAGVCQSYLYDIALCTTLSNSTDNIVCTVSF